MIYTLGPRGTFSDRAASIVARRAGGDLPESALLPNISSVFERTLQEDGAVGVVPIENSVAGTVHVVQDLLIRHAVWIEHEVHVPVAFKLLARGDLARVRRVFVHPVAERQCAEALRVHIPGAEVVFTDSNSDSGARLLVAGDTALAAVVPIDYGEPAGSALHAISLRTAAHNTTRFIAIRRASSQLQPDFSREKISLLITPHTNRPGLLYEILGSFQRSGMNLTRIESRPGSGSWEYVFFLDATLSPRASLAWGDLAQGDWKVRLLGCYSVLRGDT